MDNFFGFKAVLRFVFPGLIVMLVILFFFDGIVILKSGSSGFSKAYEIFGWVSFLAILMAAFIFGIILNAFLFELGYDRFRNRYDKENGAAKQIEEEIFDLVMKKLNIIEFASIQNKLIHCNDWSKLCRDNRRQISCVFDSSGKIELYREEISPYIDLQMGLAFGLLFLSPSSATWTYLSLIDSIGCLSSAALGSCILITLWGFTYILLKSGYKNYKKLRQSRVVMLAALLGNTNHSPAVSAVQG